ncbi:MAG: class I SAM-dependent methyltransferase [Massilibacteroides sp.]|nr:class I SAM-dependent methyltransferase [Massilibacteroides sp.]MDD3062281.1 class I SAM-dependent methyltransferase [Massilibacteroides sp.]MDD4113980.1 class I SAM-dependent methyltransferase [Massilibacteroides sp.]MDD4660054.1 class I SAM-dependent methyltransferase [Massilibacteroides sp.]
MQERHLDRLRYLKELANTSREYYIDYIDAYFPRKSRCRILEVGCGEGGNLLPFAERGAAVTGVDLSEMKIAQANSFYRELPYDAVFFAVNFFDFPYPDEDKKYDIILVHDVIEHITPKDKFLKHLKPFLNEDGIVFWRFPAWQMPFGGHQQICRNKFCSRLPFIHLLPAPVYRGILSSFGEDQSCIDELIDIKRCGVTIEMFEKLLKTNDYISLNRCLWFINPHYKQKFNLKPRKLSVSLSHIRYVRNFFTTSCYYITKSV